MSIRCSICGCERYTKRGNMSGGQWLFECSNGHRWWIANLMCTEPFPWREDDPYHPKNYSWDVYGKYRRLDDPDAIFPKKGMTKQQVFERLAWLELKKRKANEKRKNPLE